MSKSKIYNLSSYELQKLLNKSNSYKEVLEYVGISSSSSTETLKRIIKEYNLDTSRFKKTKKNILLKLLKKNIKIHTIFQKN